MPSRRATASAICCFVTMALAREGAVNMPDLRGARQVRG
jgi:hypothetical protein